MGIQSKGGLYFSIISHHIRLCSVQLLAFSELCLSLLVAGLISITFPQGFSSNKPHLLGGSPAAQSSQQSLVDSGMCFYFRSWKHNQEVSFALSGTEQQRGLEACRVDLRMLWTWLKPGACPELTFSKAQRAVCSGFPAYFCKQGNWWLEYPALCWASLYLHLLKPHKGCLYTLMIPRRTESKMLFYHACVGPSVAGSGWTWHCLSTGEL